MDRHWGSGRISPSHPRIWPVKLSASSRETAREAFMGLFVEAMTKLFLATGERSPAIYKLTPAAPGTRDALQPKQ